MTADTPMRRTGNTSSRGPTSSCITRRRPPVNAAACVRRTIGRRPAGTGPTNSQIAHEQLLAKAKQGRIDLYFEGDSITRRWGATDYPALARELEARTSSAGMRPISVGAPIASRTSSGVSKTANWTASIRK